MIHITQIKGEILTNDPTTISILTNLSFEYLDIQKLYSIVDREKEYKFVLCIKQLFVKEFVVFVSRCSFVTSEIEQMSLNFIL